MYPFLLYLILALYLMAASFDGVVSPSVTVILVSQFAPDHRQSLWLRLNAQFKDFYFENDNQSLAAATRIVWEKLIIQKPQLIHTVSLVSPSEVAQKSLRTLAD